MPDGRCPRQPHSPEPEPEGLSLGQRKPEPTQVRPWPVPGISSGIDEGRSAGEPLAEITGVWEVAWSGVLGTRRRQQSWDVWTSGRLNAWTP